MWCVKREVESEVGVRRLKGIIEWFVVRFRMSSFSGLQSTCISFVCKTHINGEPPHKFGFLHPCWKLIHDNVDDKLLNNIITIPADITMVRPLLSLDRGGARVTRSPHIPGTLGRFQWELKISINLSSFWHRQPRTDYGLRPCVT